MSDGFSALSTTITSVGAVLAFESQAKLFLEGCKDVGPIFVDWLYTSLTIDGRRPPGQVEVETDLRLPVACRLVGLA